MEAVSQSSPNESVLRRAIARLVVAMMIADRRLSPPELDAAGRLDRLGLGPLSELVEAELQRATRMPVDVASACDALRGTGAALVGTVLSVLAGIALSDGAIDPDEAELFAAVANRLGAERSDIRRYLDAEVFDDGLMPTMDERVAGRVSDARPSTALEAFGLRPTATPAEIDAAYLGFLERYDPGKVAPLGAEFAALAVRKLAALTDLYEAARHEARL